MRRRDFLSSLAFAASALIIAKGPKPQDKTTPRGVVAWRRDGKTGEMVATMSDGSEKRVRLLGDLSDEQLRLSASYAHKSWWSR